MNSDKVKVLAHIQLFLRSFVDQTALHSTQQNEQEKSRSLYLGYDALSIHICDAVTRPQQGRRK